MLYAKSMERLSLSFCWRWTEIEISEWDLRIQICRSGIRFTTYRYTYLDNRRSVWYVDSTKKKSHRVHRNFFWSNHATTSIKNNIIGFQTRMVSESAHSQAQIRHFFSKNFATKSLAGTKISCWLSCTCCAPPRRNRFIEKSNRHDALICSVSVWAW